MNLKQTWSSLTSSISGVLGFLGGYQVCHNVCLGVIFLLSLIGITVVGMPLLFLTKVAVPFWIAAAALFGISLALFFSRRCVSRNMLLFNAGILIAGMPFSAVQSYQQYLWVVGGALLLAALALFIKKKLKKGVTEKTLQTR